MDILKFPHPLLLTPTEPVLAFDEGLALLLEAMYSKMKESNGIGLAANQVGLSMRMFVMEVDGEKIFFINPEIVDRLLIPANLKEGCLSAPGDFVVVYSRAHGVTVKYKNEKGDEQVRQFFGIHAVCAQHEIDHLDGIAFIQNPAIHSKTRKLLKKKWGLK